MQLRPYVDADWPQVCAIYDVAKPDEMRGVADAQAIRRLQDDAVMREEFSRSTIVVATRTQDVVGFAGFLGSPTGSVINWLFVHPDARRMGVATALATHLLADVVPPVRLNVLATNEAARALYERLGFTLEREFVGQYQGRPCPVLRLRWQRPAPTRVASAAPAR